MSVPNSIVKKASGLNRRAPSSDSISALVMAGFAISAGTGITGLALGTPVELRSTLDANSYGLNDAYDTAHSILVYHHIKRFFLRCPTGVLHIMLVAQGTVMSLMVDKTQQYGAKILALKGGDIKQIAFVLNPDTTVSEPATSGINNDVLAAIPIAQALATSEFALFRPVDILLEGRAFNGSATAAPDLRTKASGQVGVVIGADTDISNTNISSAFPYTRYAAVGDCLGMIAQAKVSQSIGWVQQFPMTDASVPAFLTAGLSSGLAIQTATTINYTPTDMDTLYDKGYIFAHPVAGTSSYYWAGYPTCTAITDDAAFGENSRTLNKAARLVRASWVKYINGEVTLDTDGTIIATQVADMEANAEAALNQMAIDGELSGNSKVTIIQTDHNGNPINFVTNGEVVTYQAQVLIKGVIRNITGTVALVSSIS